MRAGTAAFIATVLWLAVAVASVVRGDDSTATVAAAASVSFFVIGLIDRSDRGH